LDSVVLVMLCVSVCFFFQAEDGIRDSSVTGVQTCALPICIELIDQALALESNANIGLIVMATHGRSRLGDALRGSTVHDMLRAKIGRASCRERVEMGEVGGSNIKRDRVGEEPERDTADVYL